MFTFQSADIGYPSETVLHQIDISVPDNVCLLIHGVNGSGKSSLIKSILGLTPPLSGRIQRRYSSAGYVPQRISVDLNYPVVLSEFVEMGRKPLNLFQRLYGGYRGQSKRNKQKLDQMLEALGLAEQKNSLISEVSGGELQKAMLARALLSQPDLLVLDEPFSHLDRQTKKNAIQLIQKYQRESSACVCIADHIFGEQIDFYTHEIVVQNKKASLGLVLKAQSTRQDHRQNRRQNQRQNQ